MPKFSFSFTNTIEEARDVLIKPASYFKNLSKTPEESLISLYLRCLVYMGFLYVVAVIGMTLFAPKGFLNPPLTLLFLEMPTAYLISSIIVFPILGFIYMFFSWICGGNTDWKKTLGLVPQSLVHSGLHYFSKFWRIRSLLSWAWNWNYFYCIHSFLFYLALTSYLQAPIKRTVVVLLGFVLVLLYLQYSKMDSYIKDHKIREGTNFHKPITKEEKPQIKPEAVEESIRKAMEKAKTTTE
ncbi:hypothetical protein LEP1GSC170_1358 [Leptospira interrogans serovar Bataviae str. HAI135]|nr:hypothetical protein LEP1GSC170_1358 [Leptospira interrogans serovar Bataviae str. HAI135]